MPLTIYFIAEIERYGRHSPRLHPIYRNPKLLLYQPCLSWPSLQPVARHAESRQQHTRGYVCNSYAYCGVHASPEYSRSPRSQDWFIRSTPEYPKPNPTDGGRSRLENINRTARPTHPINPEQCRYCVYILCWAVPPSLACRYSNNTLPSWRVPPTVGRSFCVGYIHRDYCTKVKQVGGTAEPSTSSSDTAHARVHGGIAMAKSQALPAWVPADAMGLPRR